MNRYYVRELNKTVNIIVRYYDMPVKVVFVDYDDGEIILTATLPFSTGRKFCAYINNAEYPWLYNFLKENGIGFPTYRCFIKDGKVYEEFKFEERTF